MTEVTFPTSVGEVAAGLHLPAAGTTAGALIVIHEWWGRNAEIDAMAERFAREGFIALAIDLYGGRVTTDPKVASSLAQEMKTTDALETVRGAAAYLASHPGCNGKVGVTGFCLGGAVTMAAAFQVPGLSAALAFYGNPVPRFVEYDNPTPPIQGHYATRDPFVTAERTREIFEKLRAIGRDAELFYYEANHAFMRIGDETAYDEPSATLAWSRAVPFLRAHLGSSDARSKE